VGSTGATLGGKGENVGSTGGNGDDVGFEGASGDRVGPEGAVGVGGPPGPGFGSIVGLGVVSVTVGVATGENTGGSSGDGVV